MAERKLPFSDPPEVIKRRKLGSTISQGETAQSVEGRRGRVHSATDTLAFLRDPSGYMRRMKRRREPNDS